MGYPELLRVLGEEAAREASALRAGAERERDAIVARARAEAGAARDALLARTRAEAEALRRTRLESMALERDRVLLLERRRLLDDLRGEVGRRLAAAGSPALDAALLAEVLPEVGDGPLEVVVDPGAEEAAREALRGAAPAAAERARVRGAPEPRGGVLVVAGRRVLDDTLPARLARAWPDLEAELAALLEACPRISSVPRSGAGEGACPRISSAPRSGAGEGACPRISSAPRSGAGEGEG